MDFVTYCNFILCGSARYPRTFSYRNASATAKLAINVDFTNFHPIFLFLSYDFYYFTLKPGGRRASSPRLKHGPHHLASMKIGKSMTLISRSATRRCDSQFKNSLSLQLRGRSLPVLSSLRPGLVEMLPNAWGENMTYT